MNTATHNHTLGKIAYVEMTETELVAAVRRGSGDAYGELMSRTRDLCLRIATGLMRDADKGADEVQNAFLKAYINLGTFEGQSRFSTWVVRIVINSCMSKLRSEKLKGVSFESVVERGKMPPFTMPGAVHRDCPERRLARKELQSLVRSELEKLPVILRKPLEYHYLADLSLNEMASRLGISLPAAKSRLARGHKYLEERMRRYCGHRGAATLIEVAA
jgi:RNA polymerase sigma-70 factor (ECF subfamily)